MESFNRLILKILISRLRKIRAKSILYFDIRFEPKFMPKESIPVISIAG